jgi:NAD(P)-dependent dehydrogenase (short-subunit alcohol dehydrogenase family)
MATVLVLGASRGIGLEFVRQYVADGERVIATARDDAGLQRLRQLGATALKLDVANPASISGLAWQLDGEQVDIALYVAGVVSRPGADTPPTQEEFDRLMHTNVLGAMQAIPQVAPLVQAAAQGRGGKFAFISSDMARIAEVPSSYCWTYRVSKAALNMAVAAAQHDYPRAIMVTLSPGWVRTDMGGATAPVGLEDSVAAMRRTIAGLTEADKGGFFQLDGQRFASW